MVKELKKHSGKNTPYKHYNLTSLFYKEIVTLQKPYKIMSIEITPAKTHDIITMVDRFAVLKPKEAVRCLIADKNRMKQI